MKMVNLLNKIRLRNLSNILSILLLVTVCVVIILLPQINDTSYVNPTITSKFIYFSYACIVLTTFYVLTLILKKQYIFSFTKLDLSLFILVLYTTINRYFIQDIYGFSIRYMELLCLISSYVVLRNLKLKSYIWILLAILVSGLIEAIYGNLQLLDFFPSNHSGFKTTGSFFNPGPYAGFLACIWILALGTYFFRKELTSMILLEVNEELKTILEYIPLLALIGIALVLPATGSRAAWLAVIIGSLLLIEFKYSFIAIQFKKVNRNKKIFIVSGLFISFLILGYGIYKVKQGSSDGRLFIWKVSSKIIADNPFFGTGFDKFKTHYMAYQADYFKENGETNEVFLADSTTYAFNEFIQFFVENGVLGVVILMSVVYSLFSIKITEENEFLVKICVIAIIGLGVFSFFSYSMEILPIKLIGVFGMSLIASLNLKKWSLNFTKNKNYIFNYSFLGITLVLGIITANYIYKLDSSFKNWKKAKVDYSCDLFEEANKVLYKNGEFLFSKSFSLTLIEQNKEAVFDLENANNFISTAKIHIELGNAYRSLNKNDKAEIAYKKAYNMIPTRFYPLYLLAEFYRETGQNDKAFNMAKKILAKEVKIPSHAIEEIKEKMEILIKESSI